MLPRWLAIVLIGLVLVILAVFLAPAVPVAGTALYWIGLIIGLVLIGYGLIVLIASHTRA